MCVCVCVRVCVCVCVCVLDDVLIGYVQFHIALACKLGYVDCLEEQGGGVFIFVWGRSDSHRWMMNMHYEIRKKALPL